MAFKDKKVSIEVVAPVSPHPTLSQWERAMKRENVFGTGAAIVQVIDAPSMLLPKLGHYMASVTTPLSMQQRLFVNGKESCVKVPP